MREASVSVQTRGAAVAALTGVHLTLTSAAGPVHILKGLDLAVVAGETVSIVGPSGSGKSSLLMVMAGLERVSGGRVEIAGRDLTRMSEDDLALLRRDHLGIVFQTFHLVPTMTALENVAVPLEFAGRADAFARAQEWLHAVGLAHRISHYPAQLSGGEQQRVALARALVTEPDLLLADEPTGNLDAATGHQVMDLLFDLRERRGAALVLVTHDRELASRCQRCIPLHDGRVQFPKRDLGSP